MKYAVSSVGSGYVLEELPGVYGGSRRSWWLCWDADRQQPVMIPATDFYGEEPTPFEERKESIDAIVTNTYQDEHFVRWGPGRQYSARAFREVKVDGVVWEVLLDGVGYPWIFQRKDQ